ncbi:uncharacterized protein F4822DRAFT_406000 [Hypoxylon trugodes]|uniref:uncharacterized protein n=1 Tax=Hypoxylon trugodes TaxID=326681 RepID=UPI002198D800|nr:uncharacterized protein F4822DRAFT_406000 [Hypoxylon trugodes]KAI1387286.1 hypothetical protein F4822DRAFT_406000 [Hypoxylon trugodes]
MCYNALTFVIQAWQGYEGIFENLAELLEKCTEFLERLESYEGRMDARLTRVAVQNLRLFVEICDRTIKLRKKHTKFIAFTKQLFLNDNGIKDLLGMMDRLNAKESLLVNAQTYKLVSDSAGDIKLILDGQKEQKKEQEAKKWRTAIVKALGFPVTSLDNDGEPIASWQRAFDVRKNMLVDETGRWIHSHKDFTGWTGPASPAKPILVLEGKNGSGKTSMMANTVRYLRKSNQVGPTSRVVTAYFFMEGEKRKPDDEDAPSTLELVSRTLLWQISTAYEAMTKSVFQILERSSDFNNSVDLWEQLFINNKERMNPDTTFFLFIDGLDKTLLPLLQKLTSIPDKSPRVFLTARSPELLDQTQGLKFIAIPMHPNNEDDIEKYITHRMDNMPILKDSNRSGISEWRKTILSTLQYKCRGDYFKLNTSLNALAKVDLIDDINEVLADADKTRTDQIDAEIRRLNNIRTVKEIQEINEIIRWIDVGRRWFTVDMIESLLSVKHYSSSAAQSSRAVPLTRRKTGSEDVESIAQESAPTSTTISLLPFSQKLAEKYPIFAVTDSGYVDWRSPEIKDQLPSKGLDQDARLNVSTSGPRVIQESEIAIVRHFLNNVCPPDLYSRFEFEQFLDAKLGAKHRDYICLDPDNANIKIALTSLIILTEKDLRSNTVLRKYAMYWLLDHLHAVDLSAADRELKAQVGPLLVKLFTEECGIDSMFWPFNLDVSINTWDWDEYIELRETRSEWVYSMSGVQEISKWLHDSSVTKYIKDEPGASFVEAVKTSANLHKAVLSHAAKRMADHLFRRVEFLPRQFWCACWLIRGYLSRLNPEKSSQMPSDPSAYRETDSPGFNEFEGRQFKLDEVKEIEAWAAEVLQKTNDTIEQESSWEIHGSLITFQLCRTQDGAADIYQARAKRAIELNPKNWHACHFIAKQPSTNNEQAVEMLSKAKKDIDDIRLNNKEWIDDHNNSSLLARITLDLGDRLWDLGADHKLAAETHRESLRYDYVHFKDYTKVLTRYQNREAWVELIAFIETLNDTSDTWAAYFDELVNEFVVGLTSDDGSNALARAADATKRWDVIEAFFTMAIDMGIRQEAHDLLFLLRDGFARTLSNASNGTEDDQQDKVISIQETALEHIKLHHSDSFSRHPIEEMANSLAKTYLNKAFQSNLPIERVDLYGSLIENLLPDTSEVPDLWANSTMILSYIRYHHKRKSGSKLAKEWIRMMVRATIELLSDDDDENDNAAFWLLAALMTIIEDTHNARIACTMLNMEKYEALVKWESWVTTSPIQEHFAVNGDAGLKSPKAPTNGSNGSAQAGRETEPQETNDMLAHGSPGQPSYFVYCDGCKKEYIVTDVPIYTCADCLDLIQFDEECYTLLKKGELKRKGLDCRPDHTFIPLPIWDANLIKGMPKGYIPLPDSKENEKRWIALDEWKGELKKLYLDGDIKEVVA